VLYIHNQLLTYQKSGVSPLTFSGIQGQVLTFGGPIGSGHEVRSARLRPEELWNIDVKIDDGRPGSGKVWAYRWQTCTTATDNTQKDTAEYLLTSNAIGCAIYFVNPF
jgi:hypothetical protein